MGEIITREFLLNQMHRLELNYGRDRFVVNQNVFELWYDMFKTCTQDNLKSAVDKCIKESEFAPNVAGLMKFYKELSTEHDEYITFVKREYTLMRAVWQEEKDPGTVIELYQFSLKFPEKQRKTLLVELTQNSCSFRHDCDACGRTDIPTIKEYIQGKR